MKSCMEHRCPAFPILCVEVRAVIDQQLSNGSLIGMRRRMQRRRAPVIIVVVCIHVGAGFDEQSYHFLLALPGRAMKGSRTILIARIDQRGIAGQQFSQPGRLTVLGGFDNFFCGIGHWLVSLDGIVFGYGPYLTVGLLILNFAVNTTQQSPQSPAGTRRRND